MDYRYMREKGGLECGDLITVSIPSRNISRIIRIVSTEKESENRKTIVCRIKLSDREMGR